MTNAIKIARAIEILEAKGHAWTMDLADAVANRVAACDGKDTPSMVARAVAKAIA